MSASTHGTIPPEIPSESNPQKTGTLWQRVAMRLPTVTVCKGVIV